MSKSAIGKAVTVAFFVIFFIYMFCNANFPQFANRYGEYTFWGLAGGWLVVYVFMVNRGYFDWFIKK